jgi:hypothetical protein
VARATDTEAAAGDRSPPVGAEVPVKVDDETAALAKAVGMNFVVCCYCGLPSLYVRNEKGTNVPVTCGRFKCWVKTK